MVRTPFLEAVARGSCCPNPLRDWLFGTRQSEYAQIACKRGRSTADHMSRIDSGVSMPLIVTIGSGKGGVGKSVVTTNLGFALSRPRCRVAIADLDVGCNNVATLVGDNSDGPDLGSFFRGDAKTLDALMRPVRANLSFIPGAGESLATANPTWGNKQRLLRHLRKLPVDVVLVDIGAGAANNALDFFNAGDVRIVVTIPEPTASVDAYRFIKLAAMREVASQVSSRSPDRRRLDRGEFDSIADLNASAAATSTRQGMASTRVSPPSRVPKLVVNQSSGGSRYASRLQHVAQRFLGCELKSLGEVPVDRNVRESVRHFLPVVEYNSQAPASRAFYSIATRLRDEIAKAKAPSSNREPERESSRSAAYFSV